MHLSRVILGPVVTEKAERLKTVARTHMIQVTPDASKVDVKNALEKFYDVQVQSIRAMRVRAKRRQVGSHAVIQKRDPVKRMLVTLSKDSKPLDLAHFQAS